MSNEEIRPVLAVNTVEPVMAQRALGYASPRDFERAIFRFIGILAIVIASADLLLVIYELLLLRSTKLPMWWAALVEPGAWWSNEFVFFQKWKEGIAPVAHRALSILLLAGGIGCARRHTRTRWWMISYALLAIALETVTAITNTAYFRWSYLSFGGGTPPDDRVLRSLMVVEDRWPYFVLPVVILWLMTRPRVGELFAKNRM